MRPAAPWVAFLVMCFALVGLAGLFAAYAVPVPLERTLARLGVLEEVLEAARQPDAPARLAALRPALGPEADAVLSGPGDLPSRVAAQREVVLSEGRREAGSAAYRIRLMVVVMTALGALVGSGILLLARRTAQAHTQM